MAVPLPAHWFGVLPLVLHAVQRRSDPLQQCRQGRIACRIHSIDQKAVVLIQVVECARDRVTFPVLYRTILIDIAHVLFLISRLLLLATVRRPVSKPQPGKKS